MELGLESKVAVITGASSGIGRAIAAEFAKEGANIAICSRSQASLEEAKRSLSAQGVRVVARTADVSRRADVDAFIREVLDAFGSIDILVNNAGTVRAANFLSLDDSDWDDQLGVHLRGTVNCCQAVIPHMQKQGGGKIVNVLGGLATEPSLPFCVDYNAAKAAAGNLTKALSNVFGKDNILVNAVSPGSITTPIHTESGAFMDQVASLVGLTRDQVMESDTRQVPLGRWGEPEEIAAAVVFLASERASYITGVNLNVDGGRRKAWM